MCLYPHAKHLLNVDHARNPDARQRRARAAAAVCLGARLPAPEHKHAHQRPSPSTCRNIDRGHWQQRARARANLTAPEPKHAHRRLRPSTCRNIDPGHWQQRARARANLTARVYSSFIHSATAPQRQCLAKTRLTQSAAPASRARCRAAWRAKTSRARPAPCHSAETPCRQLP